MMNYRLSDEESLAQSKRVRLVRELLALTPEALAQKMGYKASDPDGNPIYWYENGQHHKITLSFANRLIRLAKREGVEISLEWLRDGKGDAPVKQQ